MSLNILFYSPDGKPEPWIEGFARELPEAQLQVWREGDAAPIAADYAVLWKPPAALLQGRSDLKAVFNLGAGVDAVLQPGAGLHLAIDARHHQSAGPEHIGKIAARRLPDQRRARRPSGRGRFAGAGAKWAYRRRHAGRGAQGAAAADASVLAGAAHHADAAYRGADLARREHPADCRQDPRTAARRTDSRSG